MPISQLGQIAGESKQQERCKPDYEAIIKRLSNELADTGKAIGHLKEVHNLNVHIPGDASLVQVMGALVLREATLQKAISDTIKQQEEE